MKNLIIGLLTVFSAVTLILIVSSGDTEIKYESRNVQMSQKAGFHGSVEWIHERRANGETGRVDLKDVERAKSQIALAKNKRSSLGISWTSVGPTNIGGRSRAIIIDKDNSDIMYASGVSGGLWKSTTSGGSWVQIKYSGDDESNGIPNLAIASMCQAANGDIYFGTGEGHYKGYGTGSRGIEGAGIWKSTDGETFNRISSTWSDAESKGTFSYVNKLAADPNDANRIFAATIKGLRLTEDGGQNWVNPVTLTSGTPIIFSAGDVKISSDGNIVITTLNGQAYVSQNAGAVGTFTKVSGSSDNQIGIASRLEFGIAPSDGNYIYCQASRSDGALLNVYRSTDGGLNWSIIGPGGSDEFNPLGDQGTYDNVIAVFPDNKNEIILGGQLSVWKWSDEDGWRVRTFSSLSLNDLYYVHADQHEIKFHPTNPDIVYIGSDGGIHRSLDRGITWQTLNKNFNVTQFYGIGYSPTNEVIGGTQDNGTLYMDPNQIITGGTTYHYEEVTGGDGGYAEISQLNPNVVLSTIYYGQLFRSEERGAAETAFPFYSSRLSAAVAPGNPASGNNFITPIALWESFNDENSKDTIDVAFLGDVASGTDILIESESADEVFMNYTTTQDYSEGDSMQVVDTYQAALAVGFNGSAWVTRDPINFKVAPTWVPVAEGIGNVETLNWSENGNHLYIANTSGELYRISNFNNAYVDSLMDEQDTSAYVLTKTRIARFSGRIITGIAIDPNNADNVLVTLGGFGNSDYIFYSDEATTAPETAGFGTFSSKQGDLPQMPTYTGVIIWEDGNKALVGTEYGIWGTDNISAANPSWTDENDGADYVPVYMLRQQTKPNGWIAETNRDSGIRNHGHIWAGTHGRGIFKTTKFEGPVGIEPDTEINSESFIELYPNPSSDFANIDFSLKKSANVSIIVFDMQGKIVEHMKLDNLNAGNHHHTFSVQNLKSGIYIVKLDAGDYQKLSKIIVE
ncbi:MAG: T9SS type A sorting domain-containing protein [Bacteroidota bacterium]|nr:T9SS type A sorting domain-containing protein [Bacteroidota bacterium]